MLDRHQENAMILSAEQKIRLPGRLLAIAVMICGLCLLQGCGKKSPLEPPPGYKDTQESGTQIPVTR
jgi:predicted small lipoprotein YifL